MCLPPMRLRMVLWLNLDNFIKSLKKSKSISGILGWVLTFLDLAYKNYGGEILLLLLGIEKVPII